MAASDWWALLDRKMTTSTLRFAELLEKGKPVTWVLNQQLPLRHRPPLVATNYLRQCAA